ncbi:MAG: sulfate ABC transporter substrate-binding protein [Rickettsiales bacterium]|jgi:sulfate/thiosulfate-binding protein|nr:sulfate ABC transporter substrate-binding protein [Rickettsiales bacterium]
MLKLLKNSLLIVSLTLASPVWAGNELLNVSYDPTREFYEEYNELFKQHWKQKAGKGIEVAQSHGGSGKQARSVIDGLKADVVTLALAYDIDVIAEKTGHIPKDWRMKLPNHSTPLVSTIVLLVRKGNPRQIKDWDDLVKPGVQVIMPNPKTSGGARWNYMAAWAYAQQKYNDEAKIKQFMSDLFKNIPVLDAGARASTTTFVQRGIGDVLVSWESEALLAKQKMGADKFDIIYPSITILAEPPVAVVEGVAKEKGTLEAAHEYLAYLYSDEAQKLGAKHFMRSTTPAILAEYNQLFPSISAVNIKRFGGWAEVQKRHFDDGGVYDSIYAEP